MFFSQVAAAGVPVGVDASNLMPVGVGATVQLALDKTTRYLPVNAGDRVETLPWLEAAVRSESPLMRYCGA
ncbi:MAG: hypothetical protein Q7J29_01570 [Stagnimonas sp.]|nr:hypothetical protein [Stagnimonas sp.]